MLLLHCGFQVWRGCEVAGVGIVNDKTKTLIEVVSGCDG